MENSFDAVQNTVIHDTVGDLDMCETPQTYEEWLKAEREKGDFEIYLEA